MTTMIICVLTIQVAANNVGIRKITVLEAFETEAKGTQFWVSAGPILAGHEPYTFWSQRDLLHNREEDVVVAVPCTRVMQPS